MVEPPLGVPAMEPLLAALNELGTDLFAIVEQDMFPCPADRPLPIATRTRRYYGSCGLGPGPARR
jgi:inosose dehydratase